MATVDERIVSLKFDNAQFKSAASETIGVLEKLKTKFSFKDAATDIGDKINKSVGKVDFEPLTRGVEQAKSSFNALQSMTEGVFQGIGAKIAELGGRMMNDFIKTPMRDGFEEYETKMNAIMTMKANTGEETSVIDKQIDKLNEYADKTIYNFGEMTKNVGLFTNAGLGIEESTSMIKGFSNAAAASGANATDAARGMYQLSQGLSAGVIQLMDWKSIENAGMGNANMKKDLVNIADGMGILQEKGTSAEAVMKDFKGTLTDKKWLTNDVMSTYLQAMGGDLDEGALKAKGLSDEATQTLLKNAELGMQAATQVRTFTQLMDGLKEGLGSTFGSVFSNVLGGFDDAPKIFTGISTLLAGGTVAVHDLDEFGRELESTHLEDVKGIIGSLADPIVMLSESFHKFHEDGGGDLFLDIMGRMARITGFFGDSFGRALVKVFGGEEAIGQGLIDFEKRIQGGLMRIQFFLEKHKAMFDNFFTVIAMGFKVVGKVIGFALKVITRGLGALAVVFGAIGAVLVGFGSLLAKPIQALRGLGDVFKSLGKLDFGGARTALEKFGKSAENAFKIFRNSKDTKAAVDDLQQRIQGLDIQATIDKLKRFGEQTKNVLTEAKNFARDIPSMLGGAGREMAAFARDAKTALETTDFKALGSSMSTQLRAAFASIDVAGAMRALATKIQNGFEAIDAYLATADWGRAGEAVGSAIAGIFSYAVRNIGRVLLNLGRFIANALKGLFTSIDFGGIFAAIGAGIFDGLHYLIATLPGAIDQIVEEVHSRVSQSFSRFADDVKSSVKNLIPDSVASGFSNSIGRVFDIAFGKDLNVPDVEAKVAPVRDVLGNVLKFIGDFAKNLAQSLSKIDINALFDAIATFSMSGGVKGLGDGIGAFSEAMEGLQESIKPSKVADVALAIGLLAGAMWILSTMDWDDIAKGLAGAAAGFAVITAATKVFSMVKLGPSIIQNGLALIEVAAAILIFAAAMKIMSEAVNGFSGVSWSDVGKALVTTAGLMVSLAITSKLVNPVNIIASAMAMAAVAKSMLAISKVMEELAGVSWENILKGMTVIAGIMISFAKFAAATKDDSLTATSIAFVIFAEAISIMASALAKFENISWETMIKGLLSLGAALFIFTVFAQKVNSGSIIQAAISLILLGAGISVIAGAISAMAFMPWDLLIQGLAKTAAMLIALGLSMKLFTVNPATAVSLLIMAGAILAIGGAISVVAGIPWQTVAKGLAVTAAALFIMGGGLALLSSFGPGMVVAAVALGILAAAMIGLSIAMNAFQGISWETIGVGLLAIAGAMAILLAAAFAAQFVGPGLMLLAGAMVLIGAASFLFGAGLAVAASALVMLAGAATAVAAAIPILAAGLAAGLAALIVGIAANITLIGKSVLVIVETLLRSILDAVIRIAPILGEAIGALLVALLGAIETGLNRLVDLIINVFTHLLETLRDHARQWGQLGAEIIANLIQGIADNAPMVVDAIWNLGEAIVTALIEKLQELAPKVGNLMHQVKEIIIQKLREAAGSVRAKAGEIASNIVDGFKARISAKAAEIRASVENAFHGALDGVRGLLGIHSPSKVFAEIGGYVIQGFANGIAKNSNIVNDASSDMAQGVVDSANETLDIHSPSKKMEETGKNVDKGLAKGIKENAEEPKKAMADALDGIFDTIKTKLNAVKDSGFHTMFGAIGDLAVSASDEYLEKLGEQMDTMNENVENARDALDSAEDALKDAHKSRADLDKPKEGESKETPEEHADKVRKADRKIAKSERDLHKKREALRDAEHKNAIFRQEQSILAMGGELSGVISEASKKVESVTKIFVDKLSEYVEKLKSKVSMFRDAFDGIKDIRTNFTSLTKSIKDFTKSFNKFNKATSAKGRDKYFGKMLDNIIEFGGGILGVMDTLKKFTPLLGFVLQNVTMFLPAISGALGQFGPILANALGGGLTAVLPLVAGPAGAIIAAIAGIGLAVMDMANGGTIIRGVKSLIERVFEFVADIPNRISDILDKVVDGIVDFVDNIPTMIWWVFDLIFKAVDKILITLPQMVGRIIDALARLIVAVFKALPRIIFEILTKIIPIMAVNLLKLVWNAIVKLAETITNIIVSIINSILDVLDFCNVLPRVQKVNFDNALLAYENYFDEGKKKTNKHGKAFAEEFSEGFKAGISDKNGDIRRAVEGTFETKFVGHKPGAPSEYIGNIQRSMKSAYDYRSTAPQQSGNVTVNYEQNITSPKPLSTIEIYRNSKNALNTTRRDIHGMVGVAG